MLNLIFRRPYRDESYGCRIVKERGVLAKKSSTGKKVLDPGGLSFPAWHAYILYTDTLPASTQLPYHPRRLPQRHLSTDRAYGSAAPVALPVCQAT